MTAADLLIRVRKLGVDIRLDGGDLLLSPAGAVPTDIRSALAGRKAEILALLQREPPDGGRLLKGGRVWIPPPSRPGWCPCDQERAHDPVTGLCRTCLTATGAVKWRDRRAIEGAAP
jgi:hypothetical protein